MDYRILGRTGLRVSTLGIGGGGPSRLGQRTHQNDADSIVVVRQALDAGVNFIDTAEAYKTEDVIGQAIAGYDRSQLVISTKKSTWDGNLDRQQLIDGLDASLRRLRTDYVDVYHLHGVKTAHYERLLNDIVPALQDCRDQGKIRFIGVTEPWNSDNQHTMLERAVQDDVWDVMMVGFNILNQTAREKVFAHTIAKNIGVLVMFAVRKALSQPERLKAVIEELIERGQLNPDDIDRDDPLGFLLTDATSLPDAAYRFCLREPGAHVILSGTGNPAHMRENLESMTRPPLPDDVVARLKTIFANVDSTSGE